MAREGHLTRAAQQMQVSQSALSAQLRELESPLGHALFLREGRALGLTEFGVLALGYADGIFSPDSALVATAQSGAGLQAQHLRVGAVAALSRNFQDNFLRPVLGMPGMRLTHESASLEEFLERLRAFDSLQSAGDCRCPAALALPARFTPKCVSGGTASSWSQGLQIS